MHSFKLTPDSLGEWNAALAQGQEDLSDARLVLLNGPPYSGKDTAGRALHQAFEDCALLKFAEPLKRAVYVDAGLPHDLPIEYFDAVKDTPLAVFGGISFREACIHKSEQVIKPRFGNRHYGNLALRQLRRQMSWGDKLFAVTDSGFASEVEPLLEALGPERILLLRVHAEARGCSFKSDSRSYLELPGVRALDLYNNESNPRRFVLEVVGTVDAWRRSAVSCN